MKKYSCIVCGWPRLDEKQFKNMPENPHPITITPPFERHWGQPSFEVCGCCNFEAGNDDYESTDPNFLRNYLVNWYQSYYKDFPKSEWPHDLTLIEQLKTAGITVPSEIGPNP